MKSDGTVSTFFLRISCGEPWTVHTFLCIQLVTAECAKIVWKCRESILYSKVPMFKFSFLQNFWPEFLHQEINGQVWTWRGVSNGENETFNSCVGILKVKKSKKHKNFEISPFWSSHFSVNTGLNCSINILIVSSLSVKGSSNRNCWLFAQSIDLSW